MVFGPCSSCFFCFMVQCCYSRGGRKAGCPGKGVRGSFPGKAMDILTLQNLSKYYTSQTAVVMGLSDVTLSFSTGEFAAVTGENGSGKSTLAGVIGGMLSYESGELSVMGRPTSHYNAADWERYRRDVISFISQDYGILPGNTVFENVESALILSGHDKAAAGEKTRAILRKVGLEKYAARRAARLSSGQKQRLAIARALAKPSKILIADEPTGNLDRANSDQVIRLLKEAAEERLVILITHEFDEAKDFVTRHIVLSGGKVVQDEQVGPAQPDKAAEEPIEAGAADAASVREAPRGHAAYIARLTAKARPVFFLLTTLILMLTGVASFIFLGTFLYAADDVPSRIYDSRAFPNGDPTRLVLAKDGMDFFTPEELEELGRTKYVRSVEEYGYVSDVNYHYREDVDYRKFTSADFEPGYDPLSNPDAYALTVKVELLTDDPLYVRSVSQAGAVKTGRLPEGFYEVLSSDPALKTGAQVEVFFRDRAHWGVSQYIRLTFDVVGETAGEGGLYFSDSFCRMLNNATKAAIFNQGSTYYTGGDLGRFPAAPFDAARFADAMVPAYPPTDSRPSPENAPPPAPVIPEALAEGECVTPAGATDKRLQFGVTFTMSVNDWFGHRFSGDADEKDYPTGTFALTCAGLFDSKHPRFVLLSPETYEKMTSGLRSDQVSVFLDDYSYTQRAIDGLAKKGYIVISPFTQGASKKSAARETERLNLLRVSLAAALMTLVLQLILLRVTSSSLKDHYRLLAGMGLRAKAASGSLGLLFLCMTLLAEAAAAAVILLLNRQGYERVVNIFKYLDTPQLMLIAAVHFVFCGIAYAAAARSLKKQVFTIGGFYEDIDGERMEEVMGA